MTETVPKIGATWRRRNGYVREVEIAGFLDAPGAVFVYLRGPKRSTIRLSTFLRDYEPTP